MSFVLLSLGIILVVLNINALKKEKNSFNSVFHYKEENMEEFEVKLGELRREISETILELQKEIQELKKAKGENSNIIADNLENEYEEITESLKADMPDANESKVKEEVVTNKEEKRIKNNSIKIDEIERLLCEGFKAEEIGAKLGIGKGEVLLIKELYLK